MLIQRSHFHLRLLPFFYQHRSNAFGIWVALLLCALAFLMSHSVHAQVPEHSEVTSVGELHLKNSEGQSQDALLLDTDISAKVNGLIATIELTQRFKNTSDDWVNGRYVFPLPENGAVDGMVMQIGDRIIKGVIKEKSAAKKTFEAAKKAGKKASLLEQHRPNLFSMSVANIPPQSEVVAKIRLLDRVSYQNHIFSLRLPTTLTPRYIPGKKIELNLETEQEVLVDEHSGWAVNTDIVPDAAAITPPQTHAEVDQTTHHFRFKLDLNAGVALANIASSTHLIKVQHSKAINSSENVSTKQPQTVQLLNGSEPMNRDLALTWSPVASNAPTAALFQQSIDGEHYSMAMLLPPTTNIKQALPIETSFIIDSSGSMSGESMRQAIRSLTFALNNLSPTDRFNVIDFDSSFTPLFEQPRLATGSNVQRALSMVQNLHADGGTEMYKPLEFALDAPAAENYLKQIVFITDGAVGNESHLFKLINDKLGKARLFTVGIGAAPNAYFMRKAAQFGRGKFTYVDNTQDADSIMRELFDAISKPVARDLTVEYRGADAQAIEQFPRKIPDLYAGEPVILLSKSVDAIEAITVSGQLLGNEWSRTLKAGNTKLQTQAQDQKGKAQKDKEQNNIDAIWARQKVAYLMDNLHTASMTEAQVKPEVITLGIKHHLLTKYTSFVAVEDVPNKPAELLAKKKQVANLMPKGSTMPVPQTATSAGLLGLTGGWLVMFAIFIRSKRLSAVVLHWLNRRRVNS